MSADAQENISQPNPNPNATHAQPYDETREPPTDEPPPFTAPADPSSQEHNEASTPDSDEQPNKVPDIILGDGWAQWAMVIITLIGVAISAWAVWLLKRTLDATQGAIWEAEKATIAAQEATAVSREIGEAQVRAYITAWIDVSYREKTNDTEDGLSFLVKLGNSGQSPAEILDLLVICNPQKNGSLIEADPFDEEGNKDVTLTGDLVKLLNKHPDKVAGVVNSKEEFGYIFGFKKSSINETFINPQCDAVVSITVVYRDVFRHIFKGRTSYRLKFNLKNGDLNCVWDIIVPWSAEKTTKDEKQSV